MMQIERTVYKFIIFQDFSKGSMIAFKGKEFWSLCDLFDFPNIIVKAIIVILKKSAMYTDPMMKLLKI